ncbi:DUF1878 family protein [Methylomonas sp. AM2-LC]|uniref:DUF1878 family protein n=1 Tax=Methylomonas sp. AM2-LC TaxID=3153301 RepID=UPI003263E399
MENIEAIIARLEKLEFHVKLLAESLNHTENPTASLVVDFDWSSADLNCAHDIFEMFDNMMREEVKINWYDFEKEFSEKLNISYQGLKSVVLAFYRNGQWSEVCHAYASSFGNSVSLELKSIAQGKIL